MRMWRHSCRFAVVRCSDTSSLENNLGTSKWPATLRYYHLTTGRPAQVCQWYLDCRCFISFDFALRFSYPCTSTIVVSLLESCTSIIQIQLRVAIHRWDISFLFQTLLLIHVALPLTWYVSLLLFDVFWIKVRCLPWCFAMEYRSNVPLGWMMDGTSLCF